MFSYDKQIGDQIVLYETGNDSKAEQCRMKIASLLAQTMTENEIAQELDLAAEKR
jgi:hypothetical protein